MAICKNCGKPLILSKGRCIYCGSNPEKQSFSGDIQRINNVTTIQAVDLGLPSGTKWAPCNLGATNPWEYGGYYAWGEFEEKSIYNQKHIDGLWRIGNIAMMCFAEILTTNGSLNLKMMRLM